MSEIQGAVYSVDVGVMRKILMRVAFGSVVLLLAVFYLLTQFRGLAHAEAMDYAQLARQMAIGEGFTTKFIRPVALAQLRERNADKAGIKEPIGTGAGLNRALEMDFQKIPDTVNAPLYPFVLSLWMKLYWPGLMHPDKFENQGQLKEYGVDRWVAIFGILCTLVTAFLIYSWAKRMFDIRVAYISVAVFFLSDLVWGFSISGLSTSFLMMLFAGFCWCLHEGILAQEEERKNAMWICILGSAAIMGLMLLTRLTMAWVMVSYMLVVGYMFRREKILWPLACVVVLLFLFPWLIRNYQVTGSITGANAYVVGVNSADYPGSSIHRTYVSLPPTTIWTNAAKLFRDGVKYYATHFFVLAGGAIAVLFFVVGLMHPFKRVRAQALRWWLAGAVILLAMGSSLAAPSPGMIDEFNQLAVLFPGMIIFGGAFFFVLLDRITNYLPLVRYTIISLYLMGNAGALVMTLLPPGELPYRYPPYFPPILQFISQWYDKKEVIVSDIPWATAWYTQRTTIWLPSKVDDFYRINDFAHPIVGILFTPQTTNLGYLDIEKGEFKDWKNMIRRESFPQGFPLQMASPLPPNKDEYMIISDRVRWDVESR